jgi:hypothetical protein
VGPLGSLSPHLVRHLRAWPSPILPSAMLGLLRQLLCYKIRSKSTSSSWRVSQSGLKSLPSGAVERRIARERERGQRSHRRRPALLPPLKPRSWFKKLHYLLRQAPRPRQLGSAIWTILIARRSSPPSRIHPSSLLELTIARASVTTLHVVRVVIQSMWVFAI